MSTWESRLQFVSASVLLLGMVLVASGCTPSDATDPTDADVHSPTDPAVLAMLEDAWYIVEVSYPDAVRPDVLIGDPVDVSEVAPLRAQCLRDAGFEEARASSDGGIESGRIPSELAEAYAIAMYECTAAYPDDPASLAPMTPDRLAKLYEYFTEELIPCLEAEGYSIEEAPSKGTYIDDYMGGEPWSPYLFVTPEKASEWERLNSVCPQQPLDLYS